MEKSAATQASQRIPMQAVGECKTWQMPTVGDSAIVYRTDDKHAEAETLASRLVAFNAGTAASTPQPVTRTRLTSGELQQLILDAEAEGRERGYQEGMLSGQAEGMQQGLNAASEQIQGLQATLEEVSKRLPVAMCAHNNELQNAIVELIEKIAGAVVHAELSVNTTALQEVITTALQAVNMPDKAVTVFISEQDYKLISEHSTFDANDWQLKVDAALSGGDCRIDTRHASIDYTVAQRMEQAIAALYASLKTETK